MQLDKGKKEIIVLVVLVVATFGVIGTFLLKHSGNTDKMIVEEDVPYDIVVQGVRPGDNQVGSTGSYSFLPGGFDVDLDVLNDSRFTSLVPPSYPTVDPSEIGNPNPFGAQ